VEEDLQDIRAGIKAGRYVNEATVSQGIVQRLLHILGWPVYDTEIVAPEYSLGGRRADYALCHPPRESVILVEVKQIGQSQGADRQLFEYAFHKGVPMAVLTDGQEWHFFLPTEQGDYGERRVYKLDLLERDSEGGRGRPRALPGLRGGALGPSDRGGPQRLPQRREEVDGAEDPAGRLGQAGRVRGRHPARTAIGQSRGPLRGQARSRCGRSLPP
jgi:hypothetical protein